MKSNSLKKALIVVLIILVIGFTGSIVLYFMNKEKPADLKEYKPDIEAIKTENSKSDSNKNDDTEGSENVSEDIDYLKAARDINSDVVAWLVIPGTKIDYPIVQTDNNDFYIKHNFYKEEQKSGLPFLDYRCEKDFSGFNSIIYGHNMANGTMFGELNKFKEKEFFDSHQNGDLVLANKVYNLNIFAVLVVPSDGFVYEPVFLSSKDKEAFLEKIKTEAKFYREPAIDLMDKGVVTLSTCSYEFSEARTVIMCYAD